MYTAVYLSLKTLLLLQAAYCNMSEYEDTTPSAGCSMFKYDNNTPSV